MKTTLAITLSIAFFTAFLSNPSGAFASTGTCSFSSTGWVRYQGDVIPEKRIRLMANEDKQLVRTCLGVIKNFESGHPGEGRVIQTTVVTENKMILFNDVRAIDDGDLRKSVFVSRSADEF